MNKIINATVYETTTNILTSELNKIVKYTIIAIIIVVIFVIGIKLLEKFLIKFIQFIMDKIRNK